MRRNEIAAKFKDIIEFANIERFVDTPVERYSSGMYVRLAFSIAAHLSILEPRNRVVSIRVTDAMANDIFTTFDVLKSLMLAMNSIRVE